MRVRKMGKSTFVLVTVLCLGLLFTACGKNADQATTDASPAPSDSGTDSTEKGKEESPAPSPSSSESTGLSDPNVAEPGTIPVLKEPVDFVIGISEDSNIRQNGSRSAPTPISSFTNTPIKETKQGRSLNWPSTANRSFPISFSAS